MCVDPGTMAIIATVGSLASAGVGAIGAMQNANAQAEASRYQAQVAATNAEIARRNATMAGLAGEQQAAMSEQKTRMQVGAIKAAQAANGIDVNSGSAVDVRSSTASLGELDAINIRGSAARQAYGYVTQGAGFDAEAGQDRAAGKNASTAGLFGAGATLLGGLGSAASGYSKWVGGNNSLIPPVSSGEAPTSLSVGGAW